MPSSADKYGKALELYSSTDMTLSEISKECGVSRNAFAAYIQRHHRDLMLKRHGLDTNPGERIHAPKGQRPETQEKYRKAIEDCQKEEYLDLNISQIAHMHSLDGTALANQLRSHYPDVLPWRESERQRLGLADNIYRGARLEAVEKYADVVNLLRNTTLTIEEAAEKCGVSPSGLHQHILFYHKDLAGKREQQRIVGAESPGLDKISGNGTIRKPRKESLQKYAAAVILYRTSSKTIAEIADETGVSAEAFRNYLRLWHSDLMHERRGAQSPSFRANLQGSKRYSKATAEKYAEAVKILKDKAIPLEVVARQCNVNPDSFRKYIKEHYPHLLAKNRKKDSLGGKSE